MTQTADPDAAVQIAEDASPEDLTYPCDMPRDVVNALARAGWLHDPAEIERLWALVTAVETFRYRFRNELSGASTAMELMFAALAALDAAPAGTTRPANARHAPSGSSE